MKHLLRPFFASLACLLTAAVLGSCTKFKEEPTNAMMMAFATYEGSTDFGSSFTTSAGNDSPLVTLTSTAVLKDDKYTKGDRYIIGYTNATGERYVSGPITLQMVMPIFNGKAERATAEAIEALTGDPIDVTLLERQGTWLNVEANGPIQAKPQTFGIYYDEATADAEYPDVYIGFRTDNTGGVQRQFYGSFSIAELWGKETSKGIRVICHSNGMVRRIVFTKSAQ